MLKDESHLLFVVIESIKGFAYSGRFNQRQSFLDMIVPIPRYRDIFNTEIVPCLENLSDDKVPVVRVILARFVGSLDK
jgi:hypothetical protein